MRAVAKSMDLWHDYANAAAIRNITPFRIISSGSAGSKGVIDPQIPYRIAWIRSQTATAMWTPPECFARKSVICNHFRNGLLDRIYFDRNLSIISLHSRISLALSRRDSWILIPFLKIYEYNAVTPLSLGRSRGSLHSKSKTFLVPFQQSLPDLLLFFFFLLLHSDLPWMSSF